ncbi:hypothetical protein [Natronomonas amylolytica]|uniref:hypothetical protein n=1 Tax=Natronomonas amylolytica TaxID=3108498 RepID=UPI0030082B0B
MTVSYTSLYTDWLEILDNRGVDHETAQQILDLTVGDPRTVWETARTDTEVEQLRTTLKTAFDELDLSAFGTIDDHEATRDALLTAYDDAFDSPSTPEPKTESEEYDTRGDSIYREVEETDAGLSGAAAAGAGGDPDGDDITPREAPVTDDEIWGESEQSASSDTAEDQTEPDSTSSNAATDPDAKTKTTTDEATANADPTDEDTDAETPEEESSEEGPAFLPAVTANIVLRDDAEEFNEALEPPLEIVAEEFHEFGTRSAMVYRMLVRDALFPQHDPEDAEELFENLVDSRIRARLEHLSDEANADTDAADNPDNEDSAADDSSGG